MSSFKSDFLRELEARGFIHQLSDAEALDEAATEKMVTGYIGFDATAASLHAGSLVQIMLLRWLQKAGHKPIALMGGGTTRIGDPSFRDDARPLLTDDKIDENLAGIKKVFTRFLSFGDGKSDALMVNNRDWLDDLRYIDFLRDYGRHFSVNR
ncbi:MAG: tyrosine--tRNA ligase, partial [Parvibaculum sp.]|nr:tyrosine--tRNA ligase [Parvibaculum sp.]